MKFESTKGRIYNYIKKPTRSLQKRPMDNAINPHIIKYQYHVHLILVVFLKKGKLYSGFSLLQPLPALLNVPYFKGKQSGF
ncbi:hypothetical protein T4B_3954 [Trichinella pseudospiralis]|uniref:Uncharacterized protein n=1 Tax=Trichinella pseudospiralis TaxID=6337 RepID=A0A0V1KC89_TRIPS|nr:hypothetical protein T4B_3954 [Trichinella pseudospiralis]KRZ44766.1 hypothetical protein T4C_4735 [Trichinella pseudospiralis]